MIRHRSGSRKSSEAYWVVCRRSDSCKSGESYRGGFVPPKVEVDGLLSWVARLLSNKA